MSSEPAAHIVDDDRAIRDPLSLWLGSRGIRCHAYDSAERFLGVARSDWRRCVPVDLCLESIDALQLQAKLAERSVTMPTIFVTDRGGGAAARDALKAGALTSSQPMYNERLLELVGAAMIRDVEKDRHQAQGAVVAGRLQRRTQREREVREQVVAGRHNRETAAAPGISPRTVDVYRSQRIDKLDSRSVKTSSRLRRRRTRKPPTDELAARGAAAIA